MKTISVIIPVYNVKKYLQKCVESVVNQTYADLQIILVDDGSTDGSSELCDKIAKNDSRIVVVHKKNGGLSSARNCGLEHATGDYITFLDSDDYVSLTAYEELFKVLDGDFSVSCMNFVRVDELDNKYPKKQLHKYNEKIKPKEYMKELLLHIGDASVCTKLFPRSLIKNKRFNENRLNEDFLFMIELIDDLDNVIFTGNIGYYYLTRNGSISSGYGKSIEDMMVNAITVNELIQEKYKELSEEGYRFALFQNMAYLLWIPQELRNARNDNYRYSLQYLKKNFISHGISNRYLGRKNKLIIMGLLLSPNLIIKLFQRRHKRI